MPLPLITCLPNKAIPSGTAWNFDLPAASYPVAVVATTVNMAGHCDGAFDATRTWAATDPCGNSVQCSQTVTVLGTNAPALNCSTNKTVQLGTAWNFDVPTVADNVITNLTLTVLGTATNTIGSCGNSYEAIRTWLATDACGNSSSCSQTVTVMSTTQPSVSIISPTNGSVFVVPADVTLLADAQDLGSAIGQVEFFSGTNNLGQVTNGPPYFIVVTNLAPGTYDLTATAGNVCGNTATSAPVSMLVIERPPVTIVSSMNYNPQTDFIEQTVRVTNPTYSTYEAVRVYVSNLTNSPAITVHNASGSSNGVPYVESHAQVLPGTYVDLQIEYYSPSRIAPNPTLRGQLVSLSGSAGAAVIGACQHINRGLFLPNKTFLVEFASTSNRLYYVQYTTDFISWQTSQPALVGSGTWIQWIDNGQPKTDSTPAAQSRRFYQLLLLP